MVDSAETLLSKKQIGKNPSESKRNYETYKRQVVWCDCRFS